VVRRDLLIVGLFPARFPFFIVLLWTIVVGVWLLVSDRLPEAAPSAA
jgi:hypothetical protein